MTTPAPVSNTPVVVDYTNRDFYSLRDALIARVQSRVPDWSGTDPADFGLAMVEAFSYMGDVLGYYADRVANETNIFTATQRSSVLALAQSYGYSPTGYQSASVTASIRNGSGSSITIPKGSVFQTASVVSGDAVYRLLFTTTSDLTIAAGQAGTVVCTHGQDVSARTSPAPLYGSPYGELLGNSDGTPYQSYVLKENQVVDGSITLYVQNGSSGFTAWNSVSHLSDYGPNDAVFKYSTDANNYITVTFGDGVSGAIPPMHAELRAQYTVGGGTIGNIPPQTSLTLYSVPNNDSALFSTLTSAIQGANSGSTSGVGGVDPESTDEIRVAASQAFVTLGRAVNISDYAKLALTGSGVGKASAVSSVWTSVTIYAAPSRSLSSTDTYPLFAETAGAPGLLNTIEWQGTDGVSGFRQDVLNALSGKTQIGVQLTIAPPKYIPVHVSIQYSPMPGYTTDQVTSSILAYMEADFNYTSRQFGEIIRPEQIEKILAQVPGVASVHVSQLYREGATPLRSVLAGAANEIFIFNSEDGSGASRTAIAPYSTVASLSALSMTGGTLAPSFSAGFYNYTAQVASGTSSVTVTPTASAPTKSTITVNGTTVASGAASGSITLGASGTTTVITIQVVAEDSITSQLYTVAVTRS